MTVAIVNPLTGTLVCDDATVLEQHGDVVLVELRPSVRPGHASDRATYPRSWIKERASARSILPPSTLAVPEGSPRCPECDRVMSKREAAEQGACNDCSGGAWDGGSGLEGRGW